MIKKTILLITLVFFFSNKDLFAEIKIIVSVDDEIITNHEYKTDTLITNSGLYNFKVDSKNIQARFTFVFTKTESDWKILSHHSSVLPKKY